MDSKAIIMSETIMFDFKSFYSKIASQLVNDCHIVECGVANCDSVIFLAKELLRLGKKFTIYAVDNMDYGGFIQMKDCYQNLIKSGVAEYVEIVPKESLMAANDFNDGFLDFVFIDSSHSYPETKHEILKWFPKVKDGGILAGHDYNTSEVQLSVLETIPLYFKRTDIPDREFEEEKILHTEDTTNGWGLFWVQKQWYLKLNDIK